MLKSQRQTEQNGYGEIKKSQKVDKSGQPPIIPPRGINLFCFECNNTNHVRLQFFSKLYVCVVYFRNAFSPILNFCNDRKSQENKIPLE